MYHACEILLLSAIPFYLYTDPLYPSVRADPLFLWQSVLHEKALAEQMFSELQKKLTEQFRSESDAKEAEIAALKAHVSVLRTAVEEMRRDLDDSCSAPVLPKITASWPASGNFEAPPISESTSCAVKHEDSSSSSREKYHVDQIQKGAPTFCSAHQGNIQPCAPGLNQEASSDPLEIQDAEKGARQRQLASVDENVQKQPVCTFIMLFQSLVELSMLLSLTRYYFTGQLRQCLRHECTNCQRHNLHVQGERF